ncbi:MAG: nucleotidyltransferase family protein [Nitrososphaerales archaeon]
MVRSIIAIILAAGASTRFKENKMLYKLNGEPIIRRVVSKVLKSVVDKVVVVVGYESEKVKSVISDLNCNIVYNPKYEEGMSTSVKAGLSHVINEAEAIVIIPGDCAFIEAEDVNKVVKEFKECGEDIIVISYKGRKGHPILFSKRIFNDISNINEKGMGLKEVLIKYSNKIRKVESESPRVLIDIDTKEDLLKLR